jgi:hypothetical protein
MTQQEYHARLVEDVAKAMFFNQFSIMHDHEKMWRESESAFIFREDAEIALSLIASRLAEVTPEMVEAVAVAIYDRAKHPPGDVQTFAEADDEMKEWICGHARVAISAFLARSALVGGEG